MVLEKGDAFQFLRHLLNYRRETAEGRSLKYDAHLDYFAADSPIECHRSHLDIDGIAVKFLTMKEPPQPPESHPLHPLSPSLDVVERARRYLAKVGPAIAGQHGDLHTFKVCCRIVRGFSLSDDDALAILNEWNSRWTPPWTERELKDKINRARRYGRETVGGLCR